MADASLVDDSADFSTLGATLDLRLLQAISDLGYARPTLVQSKAIPLALEGRDILARARTGSGKTAAYAIPVVQKVLSSKQVASSSSRANRTIRAMILAPTRELCEQISRHMKKLTTYCEREVMISNAASASPTQMQHTEINGQCDILVSTPARVSALLETKSIVLKALETLVFDEADLILSYGHDDDVRKILKGDYLPRVYQTFLMSATVTEDVMALKGLVLRSPVILKLEEALDETANLTQYYARCTGNDKYLLLYVLLKLKLIKGKCLIFVNDVTRSYRVKLFLEQFAIRACVLNPELPLNSRYHVVQEFNRGAYDYIIATDESTESLPSLGADNETPPSDTATTHPSNTDEDGTQPQLPRIDEPESPPNTVKDQEEASHEPGPSRKRPREEALSVDPKRSKRRRQRGRDAEFGVARGVDFVDVACVINFDLPPSSSAYIHRVGRTARAGRSGMALSFVGQETKDGGSQDLSGDWQGDGEVEVFHKTMIDQVERGSEVKEYKFDMKQMNAFRYRMNDALRAVTKNAIREARLKEIKNEMLNSEKLQAHFEDNPLDLDYLRHDTPLNPMRVQAHMKHVPNYLLPAAAQVAQEQNLKTGFTPLRSKGHSYRGRGRGRDKSRGGTFRKHGKKHDPLKKF